MKTNSELVEVLDLKRTILPEEEFFEKVTADEMMAFIEENFKSHTERYESHYCKNIKVHSLQGFTEDEENMLYDMKLLNNIWETVIMPEINRFKKEYNLDIYTKGRSGGWLYVDKCTTLDFEDYQERQEDEDEDEYKDRITPLRSRFEDLWKFHKWYKNVEDLVKEELKYFKEHKDEM